MGLTAEQLQSIQLVRSFLETREDDEPFDGTLSQAKRKADEFTKSMGIKAMVIRKANKYDWVTEYYFKTYKYEGRIYHETEVSYE